MIFISVQANNLEHERKLYDIQAQKLSKALIHFSEQSELVFVLPVDLIKDRNSSSVQGYFTHIEALNRLLENSGLSGDISDKGIVSISKLDKPKSIEGDQKVNKKSQKKSLLANVFSTLTKAVTGAITVASVSNPVAAQQSGALEEVIVTAQHREQNIQDVPVAVTALNDEALKKSDIFDAATISQHVPGVAYAEFAPGQALIAIRGISSADDGAGLENSSALFLDGVYIGRLAGINFDMFDLERIEVLKGPQGTLWAKRHWRCLQCCDF